MTKVIPSADPEVPFDFAWEATTAAVNEACGGTRTDCSWHDMCQECKALATAIEIRLRRAYAMGAINIRSRVEDGNE